MLKAVLLVLLDWGIWVVGGLYRLRDLRASFDGARSLARRSKRPVAISPFLVVA
jgi:hypothetical protein